MRTRTLLLMISLIAALSVGSAAQTPTLTMTAAHVSEAPVIDGVLDDAAWLTASRLGSKVVVDLAHTGDSITQLPRVAYVAYDDTALYVGFVNSTPDPDGLAKDVEDLIHQNDDVEVFFGPDRNSYHQVIVDAAGRTKEDVGAQVALGKTAVDWVVELAIPFEAFGQTPKAGDAWKINLTGHQVADGPIWLTWNPTYGTFLNPDRLATVVFGEAQGK